MDRLERFYGGMLGLAVGDCMGMPWEFRARGTFPRVTGLATGGVHGAKRGEWTDDTAMAMCVAESLVRHQGWNARDAADRFRQWYRASYWSCRETCFDIGNTTREAIERFERTGEPYSGSGDAETAGNGSLMRLVPMVLYFARDGGFFGLMEDSSRLTHGARSCLEACRLMGWVMRGALEGIDKKELLAPAYLRQAAPEAGFCAELEGIARGDFHDKGAGEIASSGFVAHTLEAAFWCWAKTTCYRDAVLLAVNLGEDTDTTAAVTGQLVGVFTGIGGIPKVWHEALVYRKALISLCERLYDAALNRSAS